MHWPKRKLPAIQSANRPAERDEAGSLAPGHTFSQITSRAKSKQQHETAARATLALATWSGGSLASSSAGKRQGAKGP